MGRGGGPVRSFSSFINPMKSFRGRAMYQGRDHRGKLGRRKTLGRMDKFEILRQQAPIAPSKLQFIRIRPRVIRPLACNPPGLARACRGYLDVKG
jgi:hypothetical protein